jgi:hypothetical protein
VCGHRELPFCEGETEAGEEFGGRGEGAWIAGGGNEARRGEEDAGIVCGDGVGLGRRPGPGHSDCGRGVEEDEDFGLSVDGDIVEDGVLRAGEQAIDNEGVLGEAIADFVDWRIEEEDERAEAVVEEAE